MQVSEWWYHEDYESGTWLNDVSVIRLDKPLVFDDYVKPLPMVTKGNVLIYTFEFLDFTTAAFQKARFF